MHKIGPTATKVFGNADNLEVYYHSTCVVQTQGRTITLKTGGWWTVTTKGRMNQASNQFNLGYSVFQKKGEWFILIRKTGEVIPFDNSEVTFKI